MLSPKEQVILAEERARELRPSPFRTEREVLEALSRMSHSRGEADENALKEV